jgi:FkbM family methyltransferase
MRQSISHLSSDQEVLLVWKFFHHAKHGTFVEVGANHPTLESQTWFIEQQGWTGILIEPNPSLCELLRAQRPRSEVFQVAIGNPDQVGEVDLQIGTEHQLSTIVNTLDQPLSGVKVKVPLRTLDSILAEAGLGQIDFLTIDVEGMELAVLRNSSLSKNTVVATKNIFICAAMVIVWSSAPGLITGMCRITVRQRLPP